MKYLLNQNTEMISFQQMYEIKGKKEQKKQKESNH